MVRIFAAGANAIMAAGTGTDRLEMIKRDARPGVYPMTILTQVAGGQMIGRLARCGIAIMATHAVCGNAGVIEAQHRGERHGQVTAITLIAGRRMVDWFSERGNVVMTTDTLTVHFFVVHAIERQEASRGMTRIATLSRLNMSRDLGGRRNNATVCVTVFTFTQCAGEGALTMAVATTRN